MQICATSFCLLLVASNLASTQSRSQNNEDNVARNRSKRSLLRLVTNFLKGFSARNKLLDGAIPVELTPRVANFEKHADSNKMLNDFYSVHPINVRNNMVDGKYVGQVGEVGDRTIGYYLYNIDNVTFKPMITIFKEDKHGGIKDIIRYLD